MTGEESARLRATVQHAVTVSSRETGEAKARNERHRAENARQPSGAVRGVAPTPEELRSAARRFRLAQGLPLPDDHADSPARQSAPLPGDEDEDFSQARIMVREDGTPPPMRFHRD